MSIGAPLADLIGESPGIRGVREQIARLLSRPSEARRVPPILIQGETGTGKGLVARILHQAGPRRAEPFVDVNCAAIPETLLEAEMFGFERGAFTDARQGKRGLFQAAHHGTLFLDEIGLLPEGLQAKLLKVIEEQVVRRLGSTQSEAVDVWIIAATSVDLRAAAATRRFREDLYHRLAVLVVGLPPLRERGGDILVLGEHLLARACADYGLGRRTFTPDARAALVRYRWPGNIRELANVMERVALLSEGSLVTADMLGLAESAPTAPPGPLDTAESVPLVDAVERVERAHLLEALRGTDWNVTRAAERLGISRNTLRYRIEKHGLRPGAAPRPSRRKSPAPPPEVPAVASRAAAEAPVPVAVRWERRRLTVLRVAFGGGREAGRALEMFVDKVRSFGGRVEALSPTGLVAVFGLDPVEDAPRRAALVAIAVQKAAERDAGGVGAGIGVTVALHVNPFLIGRVSGAVEIEEEAKREAWRVVEDLIGGADPGTIVASAAAAPFLERRFDLTPDGPAAGRPGPVYRVARAERAEFGPGRRMAQLVGRRRELELLRSLLAAATAGHGQVVGIVGEPGIGKSRLLFEFHQSLAGEAVTYLEARCFEYGSTMPYLPVLDILRQNCGIVEADPPGAVGEKLRFGLEQVGMDPEEGTPYLLHLLGFKEGTERLAAMSPEVIKARTFETCRRLTLQGSRRRPIVFGIEDLHWVDSISEELIASLVESLAGAPILFVATYRPGYRPPWMEKSYATQIAMGPLSSRDSLTVVKSVLQVEEVPESVGQVILEKAQGNPFFLEELARTVGEPSDARQAVSVPDTVQEALLARIDRLPVPEKRLLQAAAVVGKDVSLALLEAITDLAPAPLRQCLTHLQAAEFLHEASRVPELEYTFKHALTCEVAYRSLLEDQRRALHVRIVEAIERLHPDRPGEHIEPLAYHAFLGEAWEKALTYLRGAGVRAAERSAHRAAIADFEQALMALTHLPEGRPGLEQAIDLRFDLRTSLLPLGEFRRILEYLREAEGLARTLNDRRRLGWVSAYLIDYFRQVGDHDRAIESGQLALTSAEALDEFGLKIATNTYLGQVYCDSGRYLRSRDFFVKNVDALTGDLSRERFGLPYVPAVHSRTWLVLCLAELGEFADGIRRGEEGLRIAETVGDPFSLTSGYWGLGYLYLRKGELDRAMPVLERGLELSREWSIRILFPGLASALGSAYAASGRVSEALPLLERAAEQHAAMRGTAGYSTRGVSLSEAYLLAGRPDDAVPLAQRALALAREHKERGFEAYALRLLGETAARQDPPDLGEAQDYYRRSLALADELRMRPLVARCRLRLGQLYEAGGDDAKGRGERSVAKALFAEMDMRP